MINDSTDDFIRMTEIDARLIGRQSRGKNAKKWMLYPDDNFKVIWEFITTTYDYYTTNYKLYIDVLF